MKTIKKEELNLKKLEYCEMKKRKKGLGMKKHEKVMETIEKRPNSEY